MIAAMQALLDRARQYNDEASALVGAAADLHRERQAIVDAFGELGLGRRRAADPRTGVRPWGDGWPNVWLGTTAENQVEADRRIPHLLRVPAAKHFVSAEPLLGPLSLDQWLVGEQQVDWIISGGESGPHPRPVHPDWLRSLRDQCKAAGTAFHFKQWGEWQNGSATRAGVEHRIVYDDGRNGPFTEEFMRSQDRKGLHRHEGAE